MPDTLDASPMFAALLAQLPVGVVVAGRDGTLELVNDSARAMFADVRAREPIDWIIARVLFTGEIVRDEDAMYLAAERDEWRTLCVSATPIEDIPGTTSHALVTFIDVTDRNRARA